MDKMSYDCSLDLAQDVIFGTSPKVSDALVLLNWLSAHKPCNPVKGGIGMQTMYFCRNCDAQVYKGDNFCSKCGVCQVW